MRPRCECRSGLRVVVMGANTGEWCCWSGWFGERAETTLHVAPVVVMGANADALVLLVRLVA